MINLKKRTYKLDSKFQQSGFLSGHIAKFQLLPFAASYDHLTSIYDGFAENQHLHTHSESLVRLTMVAFSL